MTLFLPILLAAAANVATPVPAEGQNPWWAGKDYWTRRHEAKLKEIAAGPKEYDFVFVGDSITHNWEGWSDPIDVEKVTRAHANGGPLKVPNGPGRRVWEEMKKEFRLLNLGCGGDTTANVLWRLEHGEMDGYRTRGVALMIGTNNGGTPEEIAAGVKAVVRKIREKQPQARVVLMPIFPCGETQTEPGRIRNEMASAYFRGAADGEHVVWLDFNRDFLEPDGRLTKAMMPDLLHPLEPGYRLWRSAIEPVMRRIAHFAVARPVWPADRAGRMNDNVRFRGEFEAPSAGSCRLDLAGCTTYRVRLNGEFLAFGPARGPKGKFRIDSLDLAGRLKPGRNVVEIEVHGANVNSFEYMDQPSFLQAEVTANGRTLLATGKDGGFVATDWQERVRKVPRYSFQRLFAEAYRIGGTGETAPLALEERPAVDLLPREAPQPRYALDTSFRPVVRLRRRYDAAKSVELPRYLYLVGCDGFKGYRTGELEVNVTEETMRYSVDAAGDIPSTVWRSERLNAGFVGAEVVCRKPGRFVVFIAEDGSAEAGALPIRAGNDATGAAFWNIEKPGTYVLETFNPAGVRFVETFMHGGEAEVRRVWVREFKNPLASLRPYAGQDPDLASVYSAAAESLAQNAVDVFTDCPGRERAAWIGDTFFTARAAHFLTGSTDIERTFLGNFAQASSYADIPAGEFPMVYPGDQTDGSFIPNFSMWMVLQLAEYAKRGGDRETVMKMRPKVMALLKHLDGYRDNEGLLRDLPGWVFVCWSRANELVKGVNYPSNLQYAGVLDAVGDLYGLPELQARARELRRKVGEKSWNGTWFRDCDWCEDATECCQYYAFFFGAADRTRDAALWNRLVKECGPRRDAKRVHPELFPSNSIFGYYLRFTLLMEAGEREVLAREIKSYFLPMAKATGTLWEHKDTSGSLAHGLSSYAAVLVNATQKNNER